MDNQRKKKLENAGWRVGSADEFLALSPEESAFVEVKLALSEQLKANRTRQGLSQAQLARRLGSSQSRVAKMEAADPSVSVDLLMRSLIASGVTRRDIGRAIGGARGKRARTGRTRGNAA